MEINLFNNQSIKRLIAGLLSMTVMIGSLSMPPVYAEKNTKSETKQSESDEKDTGKRTQENFAARFQNGQSYSGSHYGWNTIGASACGPSSLCNALAAGGIAEVDVPTMAAQSVSWGARASSGTNIDLLMRKASSHYKFSYSTTSSTSVLKNHLSKGGVAVLYSHGGTIFSNGGHFVAAIGLANNGSIIVADSYWWNGKYNSGRVLQKGVITASASECQSCTPFYLINSSINVSAETNFTGYTGGTAFASTVEYIKDDFDWTVDGRKDEACTVYSMTEWSDLDNSVMFSLEGDLAQAKVPDDYREKYGKIVEKVLKECDNDVSVYTTVYQKKEYREVLLAISYTLSQKAKKAFYYNEDDPCCINYFFNNNIAITSPERSFFWLFIYYVRSEQSYTKHFEEAPDLYKASTGPIQSIIQGMVYGFIGDDLEWNRYSQKYPDYQEEKAEDYFENTYKPYFEERPDLARAPGMIASGKKFRKFNKLFKTFAKDVFSNYRAISAQGSASSLHGNADLRGESIKSHDHGKPANAIDQGKYHITFYCGCRICSEGYGTKTATGGTCVEGRTIAVDPKVIPYGTRVYIEGFGEFVAEDCGGAIKGKDIDIFVTDHALGNRLGSIYRNVSIVK